MSESSTKVGVLFTSFPLVLRSVANVQMSRSSTDKPYGQLQLKLLVGPIQYPNETMNWQAPDEQRYEMERTVELVLCS